MLARCPLESNRGASRCAALHPGGQLRPMRWVFNIEIWYYLRIWREARSYQANRGALRS